MSITITNGLIQEGTPSNERAENEPSAKEHDRPHIVRARISGVEVFVSELGYTFKREEAKMYSSYRDAYKIIRAIQGTSETLFTTSPIEEIEAIPADPKSIVIGSAGIQIPESPSEPSSMKAKKNLP